MRCLQLVPIESLFYHLSSSFSPECYNTLVSTRPKILLTLVFGLLAGGVGAWLFFQTLPRFPLLPNNLWLQTFGIQKPIVMGFLPYWLISKATLEGMSTLNNVTYFGVTLKSDGSLVQLSNPQEKEPGWYSLENGKFSEFMAEYQPSPVEKSLLVHLANEASISALLSDPVPHAQILVSEIEPLMNQYGFTDLNLDIESFREATQEERDQYTAFLREIKNQLVARRLGTLTTELTVASLIKEQLADPISIGQISDRVVLMAYDFHYTGSFISGAVAPMGGAGEKLEYDVPTSIQLATQAIDPSKLILGIPLYGYEWETLTYQPEAAVIPGTGKTATGTRVGQIDLNCEHCVAGRDELSGSPYVILPSNEDSSIQQIYYEDEVSIQQKLDLAEQYHLAGVALWAIGYEDPAMLAPLQKYKQTWEWQK